MKFSQQQVAQLILVFTLSAGFAGCATYQADIQGAYNSLESGQPSQAAEALKERAYKENDDQLVYLLEYATAQQLAGNYTESTQAFLKADKIADIQDYHSISKITGSLLLNEGMVQYKGEDFEKVMINAYLAINYLMMKKYDDAMVETRRLNLRLQKYRQEAKRDYEQNPFARYLSAMIYEEGRDWDGAIIDYEEAYRLNPNIPQLKEDLIFASKKARRMDSFKKWSEEFRTVTVNPHRDDPAYGEIVLIYQQGQGPVKQPHPAWPRIPKLYPRFARGKQAKLEIAGVGDVLTEVVFNSESVAIKTLDDFYGALIAKRAAGIATKAVVADQVRQKNETLGQLLWIGMNLADRADLRQWSTLPQTLQVARYWVKAGKYKVTAQALDANHAPTGDAMAEREIEVLPHKKTFLNWRSFR